MLERRKRVFYTEEQKYKELLSQVFMTNDEIENCRFEPNAGRINDHYNPKVADDGEEYTYKNFMARHGTNLEKSHPEIYKRGILKRATREYNLGEFDKSYNTLMKGFNIESLKNKFDPQWYKKQLAKAFLRKKTEREKGYKNKPGAVSELDALQDMKEDPKEKQKKMPQEDFEKQHLVPIFEEAYQLVVKIEGRKDEADKKVADLDKKQEKLRQKMDK